MPTGSRQTCPNVSKPARGARNTPPTQLCYSLIALYTPRFISNNPQSGVVRSQFLREIGFELLQPHLKKRGCETSLPKELKIKLSKMVGAEPVQPVSRAQSSSGRCTICPRKDDKKTKFYCCKCQEFMCLNHMKNICEKCVDSSQSPQPFSCVK